MSLTTDPHDPQLREIELSGMQKAYLVLSGDERSKGFVRPVRRAYKHLKCDCVTTMGQALCETYARNPKFYSGTFCCYCGGHFPVGEFVWEPDGDPVGSDAEEAEAFFAEKKRREAERIKGAGI